MSRTIRRKRHKNQYQHCVNHEERDWLWVQDDIWGYSLNRWDNYRTLWKAPKRQLVGKEYDKAWWKYHKDGRFFQSNYRWHWRNAAESRCRVRNKEELARFWKDPEYEVLTHEPECLSWWW